ncbi:UPF0462 protein C4orf33 homolog [Orycteropus afer afer]|uniref:UPF0462 protein C4orf33 homolog n=1 Tax=Orycteropus afer afer TaxID=1230840 RepID=A0AC54ZDC1_ORYAF|nr:UPF0462 protein C4orf33 homolog [Orycteropus afer afer]
MESTFCLPVSPDGATRCNHYLYLTLLFMPPPITPQANTPEGKNLTCSHLKQRVKQELEYRITNTWNSMPVIHTPVSLKFKPTVQGLVMKVYAPFFNDPPAPPGAPGQAFNGLWEYEVVESFFLNSLTKQYLEVELCPHGQHLVLLLCDGDALVKELDLQFEANIIGKKWIGNALIPWEYFPPGVDKMNSYAIHGSGIKRIYEALYPIPSEEIEVGQEPDFHRLEYFKTFSLKWIMGDDWEQPDSKLWKEHCCEILPSDN